MALVSENLEVAFANYRIWESFGFAIGLQLIAVTSTETFLYILVGALLIGMIGYTLVELWEPMIMVYFYLYLMFQLIFYNLRLANEWCIHLNSAGK